MIVCAWLDRSGHEASFQSEKLDRLYPGLAHLWTVVCGGKDNFHVDQFCGPVKI